VHLVILVHATGRGPFKNTFISTAKRPARLRPMQIHVQRSSMWYKRQCFNSYPPLMTTFALREPWRPSPVGGTRPALAGPIGARRRVEWRERATNRLGARGWVRFERKPIAARDSRRVTRRTAARPMGCRHSRSAEAFLKTLRFDGRPDGPIKRPEGSSIGTRATTASLNELPVARAWLVLNCPVLGAAARYVGHKHAVSEPV